MYPAEFEYFAPATVDEALKLLTRYGDDAKILAGGQSLIPMMKLRIASPRYLIDVNRIDSLGGLTLSGERLVFGALCRHAEIAASPLVRKHLPIMTDAANLTADVQVRNRGTIGGSLAHADPAGDWSAALLALDTDVTIAGPDGLRTVKLASFLLDAYSTDLASNEMVTAVSVARSRPPCGGAVREVREACWRLRRGKRGSPARARREWTLPSHRGEPWRTRFRSSARAGGRGILRGRMASPDLLSDAERLVQSEAQPLEDTRGSVDYKRHLAGVLFRRAFAAALNRAQGLDVQTLHV